MRNECLAAALDELSKAGVRSPQIAKGSRHLQIRWVTGGGAQRMVAVPTTPSDWRSPENTRRDVRGILRADGMLETPTPRTPPPPRQPGRLELVERRLAALERRLGISAEEVA
jgi:hypothetical protein